ncbi:MAG TPA: hypothetical protein LFW20_06040, partial [Rickettsia endosymbiont of Omalisus fontisbellaquei]|nr:hypothetical protein [Rickettsia endosymbiont of Omalisus fontisbellaquei]
MKLRDYIQKELEDAEYYNTHCPGYTGVYHIMYRNSNLVSFKMPHNANGEELALFNGDPGANGIMLCYSSNPPTDPNELCYNKKTNKFTQIPNHLNVKDINGNTLLNELESIIDTISQISSYQSNNANYLSQNATMTQNINSAKQRTTDFQTQASRLQTQVNSFQISDDISTLNAKQKAHILQKIWGNDDIRQRTDEYVNMFNSINR